MTLLFDGRLYTKKVVKSSQKQYSTLTLDNGQHVNVVRSSQRKKSISASWDGSAIRMLIPAHLSAAAELEMAYKMSAKLRARRNLNDENRRDSNDYLYQRAALLSQKYLDSRPLPDTIKWVTNQNTRWGSATPSKSSIRMSHLLQNMPTWVIDYVLLHELAHFVEANHSKQFWKIVEQYPHTDQSKAFLNGANFMQNYLRDHDFG